MARLACIALCRSADRTDSQRSLPCCACRACVRGHEWCLSAGGLCVAACWLDAWLALAVAVVTFFERLLFTMQDTVGFLGAVGLDNTPLVLTTCRLCACEPTLRAKSLRAKSSLDGENCSLDERNGRAQAAGCRGKQLAGDASMR